MINFFDTTFYDKASADYSDRRYMGQAKSYVQYFFRRRLSLVLDLLGKHAQKRTGLTLVEDGCADGIILRKIQLFYPEEFRRLVGTDISPKMIDAAKIISEKRNIDFYLKEDLPSDIKADFVLAVGFLSRSIFADEFSFIKKYLKDDGLCIMSLVMKDSLYARLKLRGQEIRQDYLNQEEYEAELRKDFIIIESVPYGLFVPKLWSMPIFGRLLQPVFEFIFRAYRGLYHEHLYVLKLKK